MRYIQYPGTTPSMRLPTYPAVDRTALIDLELDMTVLAGTANGGVTRGFLTKCPVWPIWWERNFNSTQNSRPLTSISYDTVLRRTTPDESTYYEVNASMIGYFRDGDSSALNGPGFNTMKSNLDTYYPVVGRFDRNNEEWFWCPQGMQLLLTAWFTAASNATFAASSSVSFSIDFMNRYGESNNTVVVTATPTVGHLGAGVQLGWGNGNCWARVVGVTVTNTTVGNPGFLNVNVTTVLDGGVVYTYAGSGATAGIWTNPATAGNTTQTFLWPLPTMSAFEDSTVPWSSVCCNAAALDVTNTTKFLNREGTLQVGRIPQEIDTNPWSINAGQIGRLNSRDRGFFRADSPLHMFTVPTSVSGKYYDCANRPIVGDGPYPVQPLSLSEPLYYIIVTDPDGGTNLSLKLCYSLEFRTSSALYQIGLSTVDHNMAYRVNRQLAETPFATNRVRTVWAAPRGPQKKKQKQPPRRPRPQVAHPVRKTPQPTQALSKKKKGGLQMYLERGKK